MGNIEYNKGKIRITYNGEDKYCININGNTYFFNKNEFENLPKKDSELTERLNEDRPGILYYLSKAKIPIEKLVEGIKFFKTD
jgi:hypothetical protein